MPTYKKFKAKILVEIETDNVVNRSWADRRFKELTSGKYVNGLKITPMLAPNWEEIQGDGS